ncbi:NAD(P)-binding protein [Lepidopterella palustris CBS 459.81]|uniref:NAD(P)-binding protein n=1 Tax=Lepidopterella palustris CBS 459.81 TaxID=1314670 RepID=A0A8E2EF15_9PEZI|nr:NAD(P)-binding protein [Lepidopterella palustris CBS 459.81]
MSSQKVALITGGGSGMGLHLTKYLAENGWHVSILDIDEKNGKAAAAETKGIFNKANVASYDDMAKAYENTWQTYGHIDFVFANAGILEAADFYKQQETLPPPPPNFLTMDVNLHGAINAVYLGMHYMRRNPLKGGVVVVTGSAAGIYANSAMPLYGSAKHGVVGLVRGAGRRLAKEGIRINTILPGPVDTNILASSAVPLFAEGKGNPFGPEVYTTPQNIIDAVMGLVNDPEAAAKVLEVSRWNVYERAQPEFSDDNMRIVLTGTVY